MPTELLLTERRNILDGTIFHEFCQALLEPVYGLVVVVLLVFVMKTRVRNVSLAVCDDKSINTRKSQLNTSRGSY